MDASIDDGLNGQRDRLWRLAHRLLGSAADADEVLQDAWLRLQRTDRAAIDNMGGWLTTVVTRLSLNVLRTRATRTHQSLDGHLPDLAVTADDAPLPDHVVQVDEVGLALSTVLDSMSPVERVSFVLHDVFSVPFEEIAPIIERTPLATRQAASRARRRVRADPRVPDVDLEQQRRVVDAFFRAARSGDLDRLIAVLHPDAVLRVDNGRLTDPVTVRGAGTIASRAAAFADPSRQLRNVTVNGAAGILVAIDKKPVALMCFTVRNDRIIAIDSLADPNRLRHLHRRREAVI